MEQTQRLELKNQALLEKISSLTTNYENQIADLRVEMTVLAQDLNSTREELLSVGTRLAEAEAAANAVSEEEAPADEQE